MSVSPNRPRLDAFPIRCNAPSGRKFPGEDTIIEHRLAGHILRVMVGRRIRNHPRRVRDYFANFFAPATQATIASVAPSIAQLTGSSSKVAAKASPKKGCSNCNWPTATMPP
ncbi:hypothetical protein ABIA24_005627 [Sinorhizobium fredii]